MSNQTKDAPLDESILSNDLIRLLGSENQRLKRELQEALDRAMMAEAQINELTSDVVVKKEESGDATEDLTATERVQQLLQETAALKAKYQEEKEKRKTFKAQVSELKSKAASNTADTAAELQNQLARQRVELEQARKSMDEMQDEIDKLIVRKEQDKTRLDEAKNTIASLSRNDPWSYISDQYDRHGDIGFHRLKPFQADGEDARDTFNAFYNNFLKPRGFTKNRFVYREHDILWTHLKPGYGIGVQPIQKYVPNSGSEGFHWQTNEVQPIEGPFELLYETHGYWYYCGTYTSNIIETRNNTSFFERLRLQFKNYILRESIPRSDLLPPIITKSIRGLYCQGILPVSCAVFERIGFNQVLNGALLEFRKDVKGPEYAFDVSDPETKRRIEVAEASMPPKVKRARVGPRRTTPSATSAGTSG